MPRGYLTRAAQLCLLALVIWFVAASLREQWANVRVAFAAAQPRWWLVGASCIVVLATYALLIETWRIVLAGWSARVSFATAAAIWWLSSLGKYVPGKVWSLGTVAVLAARQDIPPVRAAGSSTVVMIVNTLAGFVVLAGVGSRTFRLPPVAVVVVGLVAMALLLTPPLFPRAAALLSSVLRRSIILPPLRRRYVLLAALTSAVAWVMYGLAFQLLAAGIMGDAPGTSSMYIASFAGSYLTGFLALFAPGGLGVRELVLAKSLAATGLSPGDAWLLAAASRLWLTLLEVAPALLILAVQAARRRSAHA